MSTHNKFNISLNPIGLEELPIPKFSEILPKYDHGSAREFFISELILKKAVLNVCKKSFSLTHPNEQLRQISLRPEPGNLSYYYSLKDSEGIIVIAKNNMKKDLICIFNLAFNGPRAISTDPIFLFIIDLITPFSEYINLKLVKI